MNHRKAPKGGKNQAAFRKAISERDNGKCAVCGLTVTEWTADHIIELWKVKTLGYADAYYFDPDKNGQTLCKPCDKFKTAKQTAERAHFDRLEKKRKGIHKRKKSRKIVKSKDPWNSKLHKSMTTGKVTRR